MQGLRLILWFNVLRKRLFSVFQIQPHGGASGPGRGRENEEEIGKPASVGFRVETIAQQGSSKSSEKEPTKLSNSFINTPIPM